MVVPHVWVRRPRPSHATKEILVQSTVVGACGQRSVVVQKHVVVAFTFAHVLVQTQNLSTEVPHVLDLHKNHDPVELLGVLLMATGQHMEHGVGVHDRVVWELKHEVVRAVTLHPATVDDHVLDHQVSPNHVEKL